MATNYFEENLMNLLNFSLLLKGFPMKEAEKEFQHILSISDEAYPSYLEDKKNEILQFHFHHNSTYKKMLGGKLPEKWEDVPVMTKQDLQKPLQQRLSSGYSKKNIFVNKTSGSSGNPFIFAKDKFCHALTWTHIFSRYKLHNIIPNQSFEARFYGIPKDFMGYQKERLKDKMAGRFRFNIYDLSDAILAEFAEEFKHKKFDYINGYTSSIVQFAKYVLSKQINMKQMCPSLKLCIVTSEMLFDEDKKILEKAFQVPVVNEYGASELDLIAFQNPQDEWEVNSKTIWVEILNDENKPVPLGEEGNVVITSLYNKAHPFIRYKIGDVGILDENSTAKKPLLKKLIGRTNDFAVLPSGKRVPGLTFYYVTKSVIEDKGIVKEIKVLQKTKSHFEVQYAADRELNNQEINAIENAMTKYLEPNLQIEFVQLNKLERSKSGKLKQFTSLLS